MITLTDEPIRSVRLPDALAKTLKPDARRLHILEVQGLLHQLAPYFTSTRNLAAACGQMEITLLPWYRGRKAANAAAVERIRHLLSFIPHLAEVTESEKDAGLWLVRPHYGFAAKNHSFGPYGRTTPAARLHSGEDREEEILALAEDDFVHGSKYHRLRIERLGHELLSDGFIRLNGNGRTTPAARRDDAPYFHYRPRAGKTLAEKG